MARNRQTKVTLVAEVSGYLEGMAKAAKATRDTGDEAAKLAQKKEAIEGVGTAVLAIGAVAAAGVALAVTKFAEFDQAVSEVKASTQESASNMGLLRQAALDFGASSIFTATEAANAIEELGKAGVSTSDILSGALAGSLDLASAGGLGIARAAEISATTLQQFSLAGDQAGRVADVLAAGAGKALGSVDDLAQGLKFVGPVAASMGVSLEETTGVLAAFAQAGIVGEQGGTSLRGMLSSLTSPSKAAAKEISALGITLYDAEGNFLGLENAAGQLSAAYTEMTGEQRDASLGILFGNEQITAARVLYREGADGVREWTEAVNDSGYAGQVARDRLDNLRGDIEKLGGAFDTVLIQAGSGANDSLRGLVQTAEFLVSALGDAPQPVLDVGLALGAVTAAVGLVGGAALLGVPKVAAFKLQLDTLGISGRKAAVGIGIASGAVAGATLAIGYFIARQADIKATTDTLVDTLDQASGAFTEYTRRAISKKLVDEGVFKAAAEAGIAQRDVTDAVIEGGEALDDVQRKLTENNTLGTFFTGVGVRAGNAGQSLRDLRTSIEDSEQAFVDLQASNDEVADSSENAAAAQAAQAVASQDLTQATEELTEAQVAQREKFQGADAEFVGLGSAMGAVQEAQRALAEDTAATTESTKDSWEDYYDGVAVTTAGVIEELRKQVEAQTNWEANMLSLSGRVSQGVLDDLADLGPEGAPLVQAFVDATDEELAEMESLWANRSEAATGAFADQISLSAPVMRQLSEKVGQEAADGIARKLAEGTTTVGQIINEYNLKVEGYTPEIKVNTGAAAEELRRLEIQLTNLSRERKIQIAIDAGIAPQQAKAAYADGGAIEGPGGPRQDNLLIRASAGEHMFDAEDVNAMGGQAEVYRFRRELHTKPRYAGQGTPRYATAAPAVVASAPASASRSARSGPLVQIGAMTVRDDAAVIRAIDRRARDAMDEWDTRIGVD